MDGYEANLLGMAGSVVFGFTGLDFYKDLSDIAYGLENWENTPGDYLNLGVNVIALAPVLGAFKNLGKPAVDAASNVTKQIDDEVAALRAIGANNRSAPDFHNNISQKQPGGYLRAPGGGAGPVRAGQAGERAVGVPARPRPRISINGRTRIPDRIDDLTMTLTEVKNVKSLSYTQQLRDFADYARRNGYTFELWVRRDTVLSGPLLEAIERGEIVRRFIP